MMVLKVKGTNQELNVPARDERIVFNNLEVMTGVSIENGGLVEDDDGNIYCSEDTLEWWKELFEIEDEGGRLKFYVGEE